MSGMQAKKPGEGIFGFVMLAASLALFWQAHAISGFSAVSSPGSVPMAAAAIMVVASCISLLKDRKRPADKTGLEGFIGQILPVTVAIMIAVIFIFGVLLETVGFILSAFAFLLVSLTLLYQRGLARSLLISVLALVVIYVVFRLIFQVILPEGIVPEREIMAWVKALFA